MCSKGTSTPSPTISYLSFDFIYIFDVKVYHNTQDHVTWLQKPCHLPSNLECHDAEQRCRDQPSCTGCNTLSASTDVTELHIYDTHPIRIRTTAQLFVRCRDMDRLQVTNRHMGMGA